MNHVVLMGRLTRDPEERYTAGENPLCVCRYTLAVDRRGKKKEGETADFLRIVAFGKGGEFASRYFKKGMRVLVSGRIQTGSYVDKDGRKVATVDIVAEDQEFAESKAYGAKTDDSFMDIPDSAEAEGLPFV